MRSTKTTTAGMALVAAILFLSFSSIHGLIGNDNAAIATALQALGWLGVRFSYVGLGRKS